MREKQRQRERERKRGKELERRECEFLQALLLLLLLVESNACRVNKLAINVYAGSSLYLYRRRDRDQLETFSPLPHLSSFTIVHHLLYRIYWQRKRKLIKCAIFPLKSKKNLVTERTSIQKHSTKNLIPRFLPSIEKRIFKVLVNISHPRINF